MDQYFEKETVVRNLLKSVAGVNAKRPQYNKKKDTVLRHVN